MVKPIAVVNGEEIYTDETTLDDEINQKLGTENKAKELFNKKDINTKTDVNDREINLISRIMFISEIFEIPEIQNMINRYLELKLSKNRKSRKEYLDALKNIEGMNNFLGGVGTSLMGGGFRR